MWLWLALVSAVFLGLYDIAKKKALGKNGPVEVLLAVTAISTLFLSPCLFVYGGPWQHHLMLVGKAVLVSASWISGMIALELLPITTVSPLKATRPFFVVLFSMLLFGERLSALQLTGVALALISIAITSFPGKGGEASPGSRKGFIAIAISIITGVASALYDKIVVAAMEPLFVQSWTNLYITAIMAVCLAVQRGPSKRPIRWDWMLPVTAVLITGADMAYFFALRADGALLSVISIMRRCSVIVTFAFGALIFREKQGLGRKTVSLILLLAGMACLMI